MCANDSNGLTALSRNFFAFVRAYCRNPLLTRREPQHFAFLILSHCNHYER